MARVAVEGDPGTSVAVPWVVPSSVKANEPVGAEAPDAFAVTVADIASELPA
jgi:hypothetical protein